MSAPLLSRLSRELAELRGQGLGRELRQGCGLDFSSNDYLGFARHPKILQAVGQAIERSRQAGSGGSRLLRGHHAQHEELEASAAAFFRCESALYFASGFDANLALFSTLPSRRGAIIVDERAHASVKEGARASLAKKLSFRHNDLDSAEKVLRRARATGNKELFIGVESLYSMDGDRAPLVDLLALAERFEATLIVDEAHATGVFGASGRGLTEGLQSQNLIVLHTCGKALGASGALVAAPNIVREYLINKARPFIYSTAPSPLMACAVLRALRLVDEEPWRREKLLRLAQSARRNFSRSLSRWKVMGDGTQILPVLIGAEQEALGASKELESRGFDVRAIRPPTVAEGACRLRISLNVNRTEDEINGLADALKEAQSVHA